MRYFLAIVAVITVICLGVPANSQNMANLPLPSDINIQELQADVPKEYAVFHGKWSGFWNNSLPSNLVVEQVSPEGRARGVYQWGASSNFPAGSMKFRGRITNGMLAWGNTEKGTGFEFKMTPDGNLLGERYVQGSQGGAVTMIKTR